MGIAIGVLGGVVIAIGLHYGGISVVHKEFWIVLVGMMIYGMAQHI